jgi:hypothetical protein
MEGMAEVVFRDLCLDATGASTLAGFWGAVLGRTVSDPDDGGRRIDPTTTGGTDGIWVDPVPEPRTVKTRVHLDLRLPAADPGPLVALGATVVREPGDGIHWWVLEDPEGNAFCAMPPAPPEWNAAVEVPTPFELVVDCTDPAAIARWWAERFGVEVGSREDKPERWLQGVPGSPVMFWVFAPVPEPKTVKNRMHWDVALAGEDPAPLVEAGAVVLREPDDEISWWVLADPEGNEFCAFPASATD